MSTTTQTTAAASTEAPVSPFRQPKAVFAVAFACVISFMGIGLVDPILPALASQLPCSAGCSVTSAGAARSTASRY